MAGRHEQQPPLSLAAHNQGTGGGGSVGNALTAVTPTGLLLPRPLPRLPGNLHHLNAQRTQHYPVPLSSFVSFSLNPHHTPQEILPALPSQRQAHSPMSVSSLPCLSPRQHHLRMDQLWPQWLLLPLLPAVTSLSPPAPQQVGSLLHTLLGSPWHLIPHSTPHRPRPLPSLASSSLLSAKLTPGGRVSPEHPSPRSP